MDQNSQNPPQQQPPQGSVPPPQQSNVQADIPIDLPPPGGGNLKKFLILGGAILGVIAIIVATFVFIVPRFFSSGEPEDVELVYWGVWDDDEVFQEVISAFEAENPHISIKYEKQDIASLDDYVPRLQTRIADGGGPDVFRLHNSMIPQLVTGSNTYLLPLSEDVVSNSGLEEEYYEVIREEMSVGGAYYGIPLYIDTLSLFVNDTIFQDTGYSYPTEWDYFLDLAHRLTLAQENEGVTEVVRPGVALGTFNNVDHAQDIIGVLMLQSGITKDNITDPDKLEDVAGVLEYYTCFARSTSSCQQIWNEDMPSSKLAFATGQVPMYFGYSYDLFEILATNPDLNIKILPVPKLGENNSTVASYWTEGISAQTQHPDEAYKFIEFLAKKENMQLVFANQAKLYGVGSAYPREDMAQIISGNQYLAPIAQQAPHAKPFIFYSNTFDGAWNGSLADAVATAVGGVVTGDVSVDTASEQLIQNVAQILNLSTPTATEDES